MWLSRGWLLPARPASSPSTCFPLRSMSPPLNSRKISCPRIRFLVPTPDKNHYVNFASKYLISLNTPLQNAPIFVYMYIFIHGIHHASEPNFYRFLRFSLTPTPNAPSVHRIKSKRPSTRLSAFCGFCLTCFPTATPQPNSLPISTRLNKKPI
jgi:hypothetical protein